GTIEKNIGALNKNIKYYRSRRQKIVEQIVVLTEKYERSLTIYLDYLDNNLEIEEALNLGFSTDSVSFYTAWVKETDQDRIFAIAGDFNFVRIEVIEPEKGESIPIVLRNRAIFRPFEV
ncbi:MAG TPA: hypothetical protein DCP02_04200, partial [Actinobacteria bacterium]|nr:hypothetical protein [Actinomycetota bacterium]